GADLSRGVRVADVRAVGLWREDRLLQGNQGRIGGLQSAVDLLIEGNVLVVVVHAQTRQDAQPVGKRPLDLAEPRRADVIVGDVLVVAVAVEEAGGQRGR